MNILALVPGGQTKGTSPSEILIKEVARQRPNWNVHLINFTFDDPKKVVVDLKKIDLVWSDMDGGHVIEVGGKFKDKYGMKLYAHGEWIPPYRVMEGYEEKYLCETDLSMKSYYMNMLQVMKNADLVSFGLPYESTGSFKWVKDNFGITFNNWFVRHNYVKRYNYIERTREQKVATIARIGDKKKRVIKTIEALSLFDKPPVFDIIGATKNIRSNDLKVNGLGVYDNDKKLELYRTAKLAVQHWSGIPPAEAITQFCPVVAFECEEMKYDYGDTIIWAKNDDILDLAIKILYVFNNPKEIGIKVKENYKKLCNNELKINFVDVRAKEVIKKIESIL